MELKVQDKNEYCGSPCNCLQGQVKMNLAKVICRHCRAIIWDNAVPTENEDEFLHQACADALEARSEAV